MDCYESVDDYCDAWQSDFLEIPQFSPNFNFDKFFIKLELEITCPIEEDDDDEEEEEEDDDYEEVEEDYNFMEVVGNDILTFWAPCPRIERDNLPKEKISGMLSSAGVPIHKQEFMLDRISSRADEIANAARNEDKRVLPMVISISIVACSCYDGQTVIDPEHPTDEICDANH